MKEQISPRLSLTTDFNGSNNDPRESIAQMAEAGFDYAHWCHEWNTDYIYSSEEIADFRSAFQQSGIQLLDTHGSESPDARKQPAWISSDESVRKQGIAVVQNRLEMTQTLGGRSVVMHIPDETDSRFSWDIFHRSMKDLIPAIEETGVPIAFENLYAEQITLSSGEVIAIPENIHTLRKILSQYGPDIAGMCFDSGHWNIESYGFGTESPIWDVKDRILAVHLHDNRGRNIDPSGKVLDDHMIPYSGTIEWDEVANFLSQSSYATQPLSFESALKVHQQFGMSVKGFLTTSRAVGLHLAGEVVSKKK